MKFKKKFNNENKIKTRKELRKEKRQEKKQKKNEYFSNRKQNKTKEVVHNKNAKSKNGPKRESKPTSDEKAIATVETSEAMIEKQRTRERQIQNSIQSNSKIVRNKQLINANKDEDKEIKKLEKLLNMNKKKSKKIPSSFVSDGLDYLLKICDSEKRQEISEFEAQKRLSDSESDFENDLALVTGKPKAKNKKKKPSANNVDEESVDESGDEYSGDSNDDLCSENNSHDDLCSEDDFERNSNDDLCSEDEIDNFQDDSVDEDDFDADFDEEFSDEDDFDQTDNSMSSDSEIDSESVNPKENSNKRKLANRDSDQVGKKVKFVDDVERCKTTNENGNAGKPLSREERMKQLMGFVEKESKKSEKKPKEETSKEKTLSKEERMKQLMGFVEKESKKSEKKPKEENSKEKTLSKEERMKQLMGFVEKESKKSEKKPKEENSKEKTLSKEERMKQLLGFVNNEQKEENEAEQEANDGPDNGVHEPEDETWEDIYGRTRDKAGNVIQTKSGKYVPPHLRHMASTTDKESLALLKRQFKGLLNRLTENNIKSISSGVEALYTEHSRHDSNQTLLTLMRESLLSETLTPEKMMIEHAMLITILHANIGTEIGASLLQALIQDWDALYRAADSHCVDNKRLDNYLALLIGLYQFKLLTHTLVYDILDLLIETFDEKAVELILALLKTIGLSLRKDNAVRFKAALLAVQSQSNAKAALKEKPRTKFMLEILLAVKNNNVHKIPGLDMSSLQRMKASLKLLLRPSCYVSELNIGLQDLLKADEKGRWWIVGSAWTGNLEDAESRPAARSAVAPDTQSFSAEMLELARRQRMNTDVRRNVFCVLMSSEDYLDAYEKLLKLGVKTDQTDDVVNVIVHCLLNEKHYNPYYTHLANHFISSNRRYRMLVQYTVWDKFKLLRDMKPAQIVNLAKFLSALFVKHALPISVLKVLEFTELEKPHVRLIRQIFLALLLVQDEDSLRVMFGKITKAPELKLLREGLHLFLITFVMNKLGTAGSESESMRRNADLVGEMLAPR